MVRGGIKSVSWYTLVGKAFQDKLNRMAVQNVLTHYPDITLKTYTGLLVFKAGKFPDLGDKTQPLPINYLVVNNLMRPILTKKLNDSLHTAFGNGKNR
ncbi:type VI immunity family protein [Neisseria sp. P0022.S010]|uniref:type VI immunity family protein n=1 Tax=Neisseria sp. P0022.S010 TaxID=3436835 RepID=UPI003F810083